MSNIIKFRNTDKVYNNVADMKPTSDMSYGEVFVNYASGSGKSFLSTLKNGGKEMAYFMEKTYNDSHYANSDEFDVLESEYVKNIVMDENASVLKKENNIVTIPVPRGDTGANGAQGFKGANGKTGTYGDRGDTGDKGPQGFKGGKGDTGTYGDRGNQGSKGPQGFKGATGDTGTYGDRGGVGTTGNSTGNHLHFEIWNGSSEDTRVNPMNYY